MGVERVCATRIGVRQEREILVKKAAHHELAGVMLSFLYFDQLPLLRLVNCVVWRARL